MSSTQDLTDPDQNSDTSGTHVAIQVVQRVRLLQPYDSPRLSIQLPHEQL